MTMPYEIWDYENGNIVYAYENQEEALAEVSAMIQANGTDAVRTWALQFDDYDAPPRTIAVGDELIQLALSYPSRSVAG